MTKALTAWIAALMATGKSEAEALRSLIESGLFYGLKSGENFTKAKS